MDALRLLRFGNLGHEKPGILDSNSQIRDLSHISGDIGGRGLLPESIQKLREMNVDSLPLVRDAVRVGACVAGVGKFICIGLNYADHAAESGAAVQKEPVIFMKATSSICGPNDDVVLPPGSTKSDWEVELGVVIGKPAKYVGEKDALSHVAGYCLINDLSERKFQLEGTGQWVKGKSADTFGPIGPWLVLAMRLQIVRI
jgi:2-keto-4-pentenoate hydratase/2-oxohepta-3-ene-1,7-dioic acid hydratase in catechol pathway